jgi:hypothetical protein
MFTLILQQLHISIIFGDHQVEIQIYNFQDVVINKYKFKF